MARNDEGRQCRAAAMRPGFGPDASKPSRRRGVIARASTLPLRPGGALQRPKRAGLRQ